MRTWSIYYKGVQLVWVIQVRVSTILRICSVLRSLYLNRYLCNSWAILKNWVRWVSQWASTTRWTEIVLSSFLVQNLRRHIIRFPVYTDSLLGMSTGANTFGSSGFNQAQMVPQYLRSGKKLSRRRRRRQLNMQPNGNFQGLQQFPNQQQIPLGQPFIPSQSQQQNPSQGMVPNQQLLFQQQQQQSPPINNQQLLPMQQEQLNPTLNPSYYQLPALPTSGTFQDGQIYPTMDPDFAIQAQISSGPNGNGNEQTFVSRSLPVLHHLSRTCKAEHKCQR